MEGALLSFASVGCFRRCNLITHSLLLAQTVVESIHANQEGPHDVVSNSGSTQSAFNWAMWLLRLHLAHYCITGKYPTWLHRFTGIEFERTTTKIVNRPGQLRTVGVVILVQGIVSLVRHTTNSLANWMADRHLEARTVRDATKYTPSLVSLFQRPLPTSNSSGPRATQTCAICRNPRSNPAAPSTCGHVFCWTCLMQWVSTVRPECPLCRSPCQPQDILALYRYEPS